MSQSTPCIGIVTTRLPATANAKGKTSMRPAAHFCRIAQAAHQLGGRVMLFSAEDVSWKQGTVMAWAPTHPERPSEAWHKVKAPLPDVIYENVYVHLAVQGYSESLRAEAKKRNIPLFNPIMPGKWQMVSVLQNTECDTFLPTTLRLNRTQEALERIREWRSAYVKPSGGYGGNGVTRIEYVGSGKYRVSIDRVNGLKKEFRRVENESELARRLRRLCVRPHLVQRTIPLMTVNGRKIDFRVVVHRDGQGEWQTVGIVPKLAAKDGVVTNLIAGGERVSLEELIRLAHLEGKRIPVQSLQTCALRIAQLLSKRNNHVALAGFDLGVDDRNHVWMIEMNPKPARSLMTDAMRQRLAQYQAQFALYLTKRRVKGHSNANVI